MINHKVVKLILEKWIADLANKDRTIANVANNFDELFQQWYHAGISFEEAYDLVEIAIKAHLPSAHMARSTYKLLKSKGPIYKTESEFIADWNKSIKDTGMQLFYNYFHINGENPVQVEKKSYCNMSIAEYIKQRNYADSYPTINPEDIPDFEPIEEDNIFDDILEDSKPDVNVDLDEV